MNIDLIYIVHHTNIVQCLKGLVDYLYLSMIYDYVPSTEIINTSMFAEGHIMTCPGQSGEIQ